MESERTITIRIVEDVPCPKCGSGWPNRPKVGDAEGNWHWRCYNKECDVDYYCPATGEIEYR